MKPQHGGVLKGFKKNLKKLKKKGMVGVAPGESFGPMQEQQQVQMTTFGDLKKTINSVINKEK